MKLPHGAVFVDKKLGIVRHLLISGGRATVFPHWIGCVFIAGRHRAGESIASLADDYGMSRAAVKRGIAYIEKRRKTRAKVG
jgi:uncharacterized protein (DUF433 family)